MIDIHAHILPMTDDGPKTVEESLQLAKEAVSNGIKKMIATPHHRNGVYINHKEQVIEKVKELQLEIDRHDIPLTIYPGQEVHVYSSILEDLKENELLTLDPMNKYLLLELPYDHVPRFIDQILYDIQLLGMIPIIPHPERNAAIRKQPNLLYRMIKRGALSQITAASIVGKFGKEIQKFSIQCLESQLSHVIASDAHKAGKRGVYLQEAYDVITSHFGYALALRLKDNAVMILDGADMYTDTPQRIEKKNFFVSLLKRV